MAETVKCDFADGPCKGQDVQVPVGFEPMIVRVPLSKDGLPMEGNGMPGGYAEYERRLDNAKWRYFHLKTDLSPEAAEFMFEQNRRHELKTELGKFTRSELVEELASREFFAGVIIYAVDEITTDIIAEGSDICVVPSQFFTDPLAVAPLLRLGLKTIGAPAIEPKPSTQPVVEFEGIKSLPLHTMFGRAMESIPAFSKGQVRFVFVDPNYVPPPFNLETVGKAICIDPDLAIKVVKEWQQHLTKFTYFLQFKDDKSHELVRALFDHTELIATLCDTRLGIDPSRFWNAFDTLFGFEAVQSEYRADENREAKYEEYNQKATEAYARHAVNVAPIMRLVQRVIRQINLKRAQWSSLPQIVATKEPEEKTEAPADVKDATASQTPPPPKVPSDADTATSPLRLFYSYSHVDEELRIELDKHLASLKWAGVIEPWHFRKITPGREWEEEIDTNLEAAHIILLLISSDFLDSNYCWEVEARRAMEKHQEKTATVIPVVLRACNWRNTPFRKLESLPSGVKAVTSWSNRDEALADVATGIEKAAEEMKSRLQSRGS